MILLLDPALFLVDGRLPATPNEIDFAARQLAEAYAVAKRLAPSAKVPPGTASRPYWLPLYTHFIEPLARVPNPRLRSAVDQFVQLLRPPRSAPPLADPPTGGKLWGVRKMFGHASLASRWRDAEETATDLIKACALLQDEVLLLAALVRGRNLTVVQGPDQCTLDEVYPFRLYAHVPGAAPLAVDCVRSHRSLDLRCTIRLDPRLPFASDGAKYPFCAPARWWLRRTPVWKTVQIHPCWFDRIQQGWARPAAGGGYHWDVYLSQQNSAVVGLNPINVVQWGAPRKKAGDIDHIPTAKQGRFRPNNGWTCPT